MGWWPFGKKADNLPATTTDVPVPATLQSSTVPKPEEVPTVDQLLEQDKKLDQLSAELGIEKKAAKPKKKKAKKAVKKAKPVKKKPSKKKRN